MNRVDFSIDVETFGLKSNAHIISIGCAAFNITSGVILERFENVLLQRRQINREVCLNVIYWWLGQDDKARELLIAKDKPKYDLGDSLLNLNRFISSWVSNDPNNAYVWGNGSYFDISILEDAFNNSNKYASKPFWNFRKVRDMRTIVDVATALKGFDKKSIVSDSVRHSAVDDAVHQAKVISAAYAALRGDI